MQKRSNSDIGDKMAVDTTELSTVYDKLIGMAKKTINAQYEEGRLVGTDFAETLNAAIAAAMQLSLSSVQGQPVLDGQVLDSKVKSFVALANAQKDIEIKDMEIQLATAQIGTENAKQASIVVDDTVKQAISNADTPLKVAQKELINLQAETEVKKESLTTRQNAAYDDVRANEKVDALANVAGMYAAGGSISVGLETELEAAVKAVEARV